MVSSCKNFYSHKNVLLKDHLAAVGEECKRYVLKTRINLVSKQVAEIVGKSHDFGKYTSYFQAHLKGDRVNPLLSRHSKLSALFTGWKVYSETESCELALSAFMVVMSHHGRLPNLQYLAREFGEVELFLTYPVLKDQVRSLQKNVSQISCELQEIGLAKADDFINNFEDRVRELYANFKKYTQQIVTIKLDPWARYYRILLLFSMLIDADKKEAGHFKVAATRFEEKLLPEVVAQYRVKCLPPPTHERLSRIREKLFETVKRRLDTSIEEAINRRVLTLTAPTGSGKTLVGLYVALRIREKLVKQGLDPKIVYSLPYINIIEQNYAVFKKVLCPELLNDQQAPAPFLLKSHHLFFPEIDDENDQSLQQLMLLVDAWDSCVIVTTFIQLLNSLVAQRNCVAKKVHNLANAIIILDEVQALPLEYWRIVRDLLIQLASKLGCIIIFMTATMPTVFGKKADAFELATVPINFSRTQFYPQLETSQSLEELVSPVTTQIENNKSVLIVLNTIRSSLKFYRKLADRFGEYFVRLKTSILTNTEDKLSPNSQKPVLAYLSTNITPAERIQRLELISKALREKRQVVLVSTQVVEAGVDLDFDVVFRDMAPLDSINQVAGRCNRNDRAKKKKSTLGNVFVVRIKETSVEDSCRIYGQVLIQLSERFLTKPVEEKKFHDLIEEYYNKVDRQAGGGASETSDKLCDCIKQLNFKDLAQQFQLIENQPKIPVFIEENDDATKALEIFTSLLQRMRLANRDEFFKCYAELRAARIAIENHTVNVWNAKGLPNVEQKANLRRVCKDEIEAYYDGETGFKGTEDDESTIW